MVKQIVEKNESVLPNSREMEVLKQNFPSCFNADGSFDIERFKEFLKDKVNVTKEGYELKFLGKNYARLLASVDTTTVIVPDEENNSKPENKDSENIYITGDNLDALKHLLQSYSGKVKCIYIDPPYNTGSDGFVYNDRFNFTAEDLAVKLSIDEEQAERILDLTKRGSASHSAWLMFMYPRLLLARDLLSDDGVIFISIDDNEQSNLKLLCDDVFGEQNFIGELIIQTATDNNPTQINTEHEFMECYVKNSEVQDAWGIKSQSALMVKEKYEEIKRENDDVKVVQEKLRKWIKANKELLSTVEHYNCVDENGVFSKSQNSANPHPGGYMYDIFHPITHKVCPKPANGWRWKEETFLEYANSGEVCWGKDESTQPHVKKRIETVREQLRSIIYEDNRASSIALDNLFDGKKVFENPKPLNVVTKIISFVSRDNDFVVDFFSGSATTAHAVMQLNAENEDSKRKFIMVQLPEPAKPGSEAEKAGYKTIDQIGRERIRRAAAKIKAEHPDTMADLGFKHYVLQEPQGETLDKLEKFVPKNEDGAFLNNDIFSQFGLPTVLTTWLVRDGYGLNAKPQEVDFAGYKGYYMGQHLYLIDEGLTDEAVTAIVTKFDEDSSFNPDKVVVFGYNFLWTKLQALKDNLARLKDTEKNIRIVFDVRY